MPVWCSQEYLSSSVRWIGDNARVERKSGAMHVAKIERRHGDRVYTSRLVRRSVREGKRVRHETIANVSRLPEEAIEALARALRGEGLVAFSDRFRICDPLPHGHVEAVVAAARRLGLQRLLDRAPSKERDLALALICQRVLSPGSKLFTARALSQSTLAAQLRVEGADQDDLYRTMDWLLARQARIEDRLARRHLQAGTLVLYDVSSSYFEGRSCPLARVGYSRDGRRGTPQIVYGLLCDARGCPVAVEVFEGSLHDDQNLAEIESEHYPGERLVVCRNPLVAEERARKREALLAATERELSQIERRVREGTLCGEAEIGLADGAVWNRYRVKKHFALEITDTSFSFSPKSEQIEAEARLDGIYALRTSTSAETLATTEVVRSYKQLREVERAFRSFKGPLEIRPVHHRLEERVRSHVFLCTLAYYLEWHLRQAWAELTFTDECPPSAPDPVAKASRSPAAEHKARAKRTNAGQAPHSFRSLIAELGRRTSNTIQVQDTKASFAQLSESTTLQARALELVHTKVPKIA